MRRSEIHKELLLHIGRRLLSDPDDLEELEEEIDFTAPVDSREWFKDIQCKGYNSVIELICKACSVPEDPEITAPAFTDTFKVRGKRHKSEIKPFAVYDSNSSFGLVTGLALSKLDTIDQDSEVLNALTHIWAGIRGDTDKVEKFLDFCNTPASNVFYVFHNQHINDLWNAYGYACLYKINSGRFDVHNDLSFNPHTVLLPTLQYDSSTPYKQYFDIYHVLSESKYCTDILKRYLSIYQVYEDMCYRRSMVMIAKDQFNRNGFVRNTMKVMKDIGGEEKTIIDSFAKLYPNIHLDITNVNITPYNSFIKKVYDIDANNHSCKKLARIIYKLRNSIVHNKHTEFHFSYGNVEEYRVIIPLIKLLIEKLEKRAMTIMNDHSIKVIDYKGSQLPLY